MNLSKLLRNNWDRAAAVVAIVAAVIALLLGWRGVSDVTLATEQLPYLASGLGFGMFFLGVGTTLWLSADLRDSWRRLGDVHRVLVADQQDGDEPEDSRTSTGVASVAENSRRRRLRATGAADA